MAKVYPGTSPCSSSDEREKYTVWMKSLVYNSNGFTVYDSEGNLAYRVDNYGSKSSNQVFLMDLKGEVLCTLHKKKFRVLEHWNGYKGERVKNKKPWFEVKKRSTIFNKGSQFLCQVIEKSDSCHTLSSYLGFQGRTEKSELQIIGNNGLVAAEVKRKQASKGITLGSDVFSLEVVPCVDHSFIMALVVVHGLMSHKI